MAQASGLHIEMIIKLDGGCIFLIEVSRLVQLRRKILPLGKKLNRNIGVIVVCIIFRAIACLMPHSESLGTLVEACL